VSSVNRCTKKWALTLGEQSHRVVAPRAAEVVQGHDRTVGGERADRGGGLRRPVVRRAALDPRVAVVAAARHHRFVVGSTALVGPPIIATDARAPSS
jgi:hypothetical protein